MCVIIYDYDYLGLPSHLLAFAPPLSCVRPKTLFPLRQNASGAYTESVALNTERSLG